MDRWVSTWAIAEGPSEVREAEYVKNITLRFVVPVMTTGSKVRFTFSNKYGNEKIVLRNLTIGLNEGAKIDGSSRDDVTIDIKPITFKGKDKVKIAPHDIVVSDEIDYFVKKGDFISVSFFIKGFNKISTSTELIGKYSYGYMMLGNGTDLETFPPYISRDSLKTSVLCGVDVLSDDEEQGALICFGDSITSQYYVDELANLVLESESKTSIVRKSLSGNRVLRTYRHIGNVKYGEAGVIRFDNDIDRVSGADGVLILHGINDLIHPDGSMYRPLQELPSAEEIISAYEEKYITSARRRGLKVYFGTILPFGEYKTYSPERDEIRQHVNKWIRTTDKIDGFVDFERAVKDEKIPTRIRRDFTSDNIHPNQSGGKAMAKAVFDELFK